MLLDPSMDFQLQTLDQMLVFSLLMKTGYDTTSTKRLPDYLGCWSLKTHQEQKITNAVKFLLLYLREQR